MRAIYRALTVLAVYLAVAAPATGAPTVVRVSIDGPILPPTAEYFGRALERAARERASCVLVEMNTPGGRGDAMEDIVRSELASRVPVVVYVTPDGGRAASAGAVIGLGANVLAMAPGSHIGAAHPVAATGEDIAKDMRAKVENDAAALVRSIAERRRRDPVVAEDMIRKSISLTADEAVKKRVADLVSPTRADLLTALDGRAVQTAAGSVVLHTRGAHSEDEPLTTRERFLLFLFDPNVAVILGVIAMLGIITEISHPGLGVPGVAGAVALVLNLYVLSVLSASATGLILLGLAAVFFVSELYLPTHGALTVGGTVSFVVGCLLLFQGSPVGVRVSPGLVATLAVLLALFFFFVVGAIVRTRRRPPATGPETLIGTVATARTALAPRGKVFTEGAFWTAVNVGPEPVRAGDLVVIEARSGLTLNVRRALAGEELRDSSVGPRAAEPS